MSVVETCCEEPITDYCNFYQTWDKACLADVSDILVVDLGVGGWTDTGFCDQCNEIAGEYELTALDVPYFSACRWRYLVQNYCGNSQLAIAAYIAPGPTTGWIWRVIITLAGGGDWSHVWWESAEFDIGEHCWRPDDGTKITLTKVDDTAVGIPCGGGGNMPNTIQMWQHP